MSGSANRSRLVFELVSTIVMIGLAGALVWQNYNRPSRPDPTASLVPIPKNPIAFALVQSKGARTARIGLLVYSDFQCPYCSKAANEIIPAIERDYVNTGSVRIVFKNLPLPNHPLAQGAAAAALCAGEQDRFWQMHDRLFTEPVGLVPADLRNAARDVGVDLSAFSDCLEQPAIIEQIQEEKAEAAALGISGTPTFIFGNIDTQGHIVATDVLNGAKPVASFREILDRLLKAR